MEDLWQPAAVSAGQLQQEQALGVEGLWQPAAVSAGQLQQEQVRCQVSHTTAKASCRPEQLGLSSSARRAPVGTGHRIWCCARSSTHGSHGARCVTTTWGLLRAAYKYSSSDALGVLTEMQKNLATVQRPPLILLGLLLGPTGPGPDMLVL